MSSSQVFRRLSFAWSTKALSGGLTSDISIGSGRSASDGQETWVKPNHVVGALSKLLKRTSSAGCGVGSITLEKGGLLVNTG